MRVLISYRGFELSSWANFQKKFLRNEVSLVRAAFSWAPCNLCNKRHSIPFVLSSEGRICLCLDPREYYIDPMNPSMLLSDQSHWLHGFPSWLTLSNLTWSYLGLVIISFTFYGYFRLIYNTSPVDEAGSMLHSFFNIQTWIVSAHYHHLSDRLEVYHTTEGNVLPLWG